MLDDFALYDIMFIESQVKWFFIKYLFFVKVEIKVFLLYSDKQEMQFLLSHLEMSLGMV